MSEVPPSNKERAAWSEGSERERTSGYVEQSLFRLVGVGVSGSHCGEMSIHCSCLRDSGHGLASLRRLMPGPTCVAECA